MVLFKGKDLQNARQSVHITRPEMAEKINYSDSRIEEWEKDKSLPPIDVVFQMAQEIGDLSIWHKWMMSHYDSYRYFHSDWNDASLPAAALQCRIASENLAALQGMVDRDVVDGRFDDAQLKVELKAALNAAIAANTEMLSKL